MNGVFFEQLNLTEAKYNLDVGSELNKLAGNESGNIVNCPRTMFAKGNRWKNLSEMGKLRIESPV